MFAPWTGHGLQDLNCKSNSRVSATNLHWLVKALNTHASKLGIVGMRSVAGRVVMTPTIPAPFDNPLRQHTADATAAAKRSAGAIARGVVEGITRKGPLDINKASEKDLAQLPGVTPAQAHAIVAERPYDNTSQLVKRRIITKAQYEKIRAKIGVN